MTLITNHSLIVKKTVRFIGVGAVSVSTGGSINPTYPSGLIPGDIAFLQSYHRSSSQTLSAFGGFNLLYNDVDSGPFTRQYILYRLIDGTEPGSATVPNSGGGVLHMGRICAIRGAVPTSFINGTDFVEVNSTLVAHGTILGSRGGLALSFVGLSDDLAMSEYSGEVGGNWVEGYQNVSSLGDDGGIQMQYTPLGISGNLSGGSYNIASTRVKLIRSFSVKPK